MRLNTYIPLYTNFGYVNMVNSDIESKDKKVFKLTVFVYNI